MANKDVPVKSVQTAFQVIDALIELDDATVSEVSEYLGIPVSTTNDHLKTLCSYNKIVVKEGKTYRIGPGLVNVAGYARDRLDLFNVSRREVDTLAQETGEHANLAVFDGDTGRLIYQALGENSVRQTTHIGRELPMHVTSLGKAILSELPEQTVDDIVDQQGLSEITDQSITSRNELYDELEQIRDQGYATDTGEFMKGMHCLGVPITSIDGEVEGAISVSGPIKRMTGSRFTEKIPKKVQETANVIEVNFSQLG